MHGKVDVDIAKIARIGVVPTILDMLSEMTQLRLSLVARVTFDEWTCCAANDKLGFGMHVGDQLVVATTICSEIRDSHLPVVIEHASAQPEFCNHPTPKLYGFESYLAVPILLPSGAYFGNLCALDSEPRRIDARSIATTKLFADLIALHLGDQEDATRREQFIAVLGHDVRTPLTSIMAGTEILLRRGLEDSNQRIAQRILQSAHRIEQLVGDLLDFGRGRLGGHIAVARSPIDDVERLWRGVVEEVATSHTTAELRFTADNVGAMTGDATRLAQLMSNLLVNAIDHGAPGRPIDIAVRGSADRLVFTIHNEGDPIPAETRARLFQPFTPTRPGSRGSGLGLFIVSEIARSHGGGVEVVSDTNGTTFTVTLPRDATQSIA